MIDALIYLASILALACTGVALWGAYGWGQEHARRRIGKCLGCGDDFVEFPERRHSRDECPGPECSCYEMIGGHQPGCYYHAVLSIGGK